MEKIIFVYNKDAGFMNGVFDFFHKIVKPATYDCSLCSVTYSNFGMRQTWKDFIESLPLESAFYHKDEFIAHLKSDSDFKLPAIFILKENGLIPLVSREELNQSDLAELMKLIERGLGNFNFNNS